MIFRDRVDAGRQLAEALEAYRREDVVVLGLPRGGVLVAAEIAAHLDAPLDVIVVRKLGAPRQPELAIGAVTDVDAPHLVLNDEIVRAIGVDREYIDAELKQQLDLVRERQRLYREGRDPAPVRGKTVVVVDDGIATGATMRAVLEAMRQRDLRRLVLAVPVAPARSVEILSAEADDVVCLATPPGFSAVGQYYHRFDEVSDQDVVRLLRERTANRSTGTSKP